MSDLPGMIGPYQVLRQLGAGGMGEVFLAYDARLDRHVAIKRIRIGAGATPERRERFRREARVAAKLNHPAIVQIYDVLSEGEASYIVMEHVEGTNLRRLLDEGALPVEEVVVLARDVAEGLAEAHRQGIVHRDLKSENVLVTPEGRGKIADFGIAKRVLAGTDEGALTADGHVLGTYRTMSPEQARGEMVDFRSDLFSLGVLLYEALAGQSPFEADNELAMLNRIVHDRQAPLETVRPEVSRELSDLVDQLLEKDPLARPRSAREVAQTLAGGTVHTHEETGTRTVMEPLSWTAPRSSTAGPPPQAQDSALTVSGRRFGPLTWVAGALLLLAVGALAWISLRPARHPLYVAVLRPEVEGLAQSPEESELLASAVRLALLQGALGLEDLSPRSFDEVDKVAGPATAIARAVSVDELVSAKLSCRDELCRIVLSRLSGKDGSILWAGRSFEVPTDNLSVLANAASQQLRLGYPGHSVRKGAEELEVTDKDLRELLQIRRRFDSRQEPLPALEEELAAIRARSPRFLDAYLLAADVARHRFWTSRNPEDLQRGLRLIEQAHDLAPDDPQPLFARIDLALAGKDVALAQKTLEELRPLIPGDVGLLERSSRILDAQGKSREALAQLRTAARLQPSSKRLHNLAQLELKLGHVAEAKSTLNLLLQRSPGDFDGMSMLATIELLSGDANRAIELYRQLVSHSSGTTELSNLSVAYLFARRYAEAADTAKTILAREPGNPLYVLNLGDAYLLMDRRPEAEEQYRRVLELTGSDLSKTDPQFLTVKAQALAHLGQGRQAVAAVQEALRLAPDNGSTAYEASLVYALLGEDDSALFNAERAFKAGYGARWYSFPWFDSLRQRPEFQAMTASASKGAPAV
ncbi:MAG TPA: protein kinase [Thermoanaerobaculia bacterium]|nr:protein kinase [Thermoanaerobaculia bacterium]